MYVENGVGLVKVWRVIKGSVDDVENLASPATFRKIGTATCHYTNTGVYLKSKLLKLNVVLGRIQLQIKLY